MKLCKVLLLASFAAALAVLSIGARAQTTDAPLLLPGENGPSADQKPIKLIPPDQSKKKKKPKRPAVTAPAPAANAQSATPDTADQSETLSTLDTAPSATETVNQAPTPSPMTIGSPSETPAGPANRVPLALTPTSPDIIIGEHGRPINEGPSAAASQSPRRGEETKNKTFGVGTRKVSSQLAVVAPAQSSLLTPNMAVPAPATIVASTEPNLRTRGPTADLHRGLTKRSEIVFPEGAVDPTPDTISDLRKLASELSGMLRGTTRIQLEAFGGPPGDKSSDSRRLSLKRALAVRALLIESGVPAERIDVRALGGSTDGGTPDRVDVFVRSG